MKEFERRLGYRFASRELLEDVAYAGWSPDGANLAVVRAPQWRYRLEYPAGKVLYETTGYISHPRVSPGDTSSAHPALSVPGRGEYGKT